MNHIIAHTLLSALVVSHIYHAQAAVVPDVGNVSARTVLDSSDAQDSRQAELSVTSAQTGGASKRPLRVVFSGFFNVTATVWLSPNETEAMRQDGRTTKPWSVTTALNFSALQGPLAVSFGAANAYAAANLTAAQPSSSQSAALGGSVRLADKALTGFGKAIGSAQGDSKASAIGASSRLQRLSNTAHGGGGASVQIQAGRGGALARGIAAGIGNGAPSGTARSSATAQGAGAAAGVGSSGDAFYGEGKAHGDRRVMKGERSNDTVAYGMGSGSNGSNEKSDGDSGGGGGGNGAAAGFGANSNTFFRS